MKRLSRNKKRLIAILIIEVIIAINVFATFAADYVIDEHAGENKDQIELVQVVATEEEAKEIRDAAATPGEPAPVGEDGQPGGEVPEGPAVEVNKDLVEAIDEFTTINEYTDEFAVYADDLTIGVDHIEGNIVVDELHSSGDETIKAENDWSGDDGSSEYGEKSWKEQGLEAGDYSIVLDSDKSMKTSDKNLTKIYTEKMPMTDENGNPEYKKDWKGDPIKDYEGNPIQKDRGVYDSEDPNNTGNQGGSVVAVEVEEKGQIADAIAAEIVGKPEGTDGEYTDEQKVKLEYVKQQVNVKDTLSKLADAGEKIEEALDHDNTLAAVQYLYETKTDKDGNKVPSIISTLKAEDTIVLKFTPDSVGKLDFQNELMKLRKENVNGAKIIIQVDTKNATSGITVVTNYTGNKEDVHDASHNTVIMSFGNYEGTVKLEGNTEGVFITPKGQIINTGKIQGRMVADKVEQGGSEIHAPGHTEETIPSPSAPVPSEPNESPSAPVPSAPVPSEPNESPSEVVSPSPLVVDLKVEKTVETPADRPWLEDEEFEFKLHVFEKTANTSIDLSGIGVEKDANGEYNEVSIKIGKDKPIDTFGQLVFKAPLTKEEAIQDGFWDQTSWHKDNGTQEVKDKINTDGTEIWMSRVYIRVKEVVDETLEQAGWGFDKMIHSIKVFFNVSYTDGKLDKQWVEVREAIDEEYTNDVKSDKFFWTKGEGEAVATDPASTVAPGGDNHGINNECDDFGEKMTFKNVLTVTPTPTPSESAEEKPSTTPSEPAKVTPTPSGTPEESASATPSGTPEESASATPSGTPEESASATPSGTPEESASATPSGTPEVTPSETPDETPSPSAPADETPSPSAPADETPSPSAPADETPSPSAPADETPSPSAPTEEVPSPSAPADEIVPPPPFVPEVPETPAEVLGARRVQGGGTVLGARRGLDKAVLGKRRAPQTGDSIAIFLWIAALAATMGGAVVSAVALKKTK